VAGTGNGELYFFHLAGLVRKMFPFLTDADFLKITYGFFLHAFPPEMRKEDAGWLWHPVIRIEGMCSF
jgi:hypothetical protein